MFSLKKMAATVACIALPLGGAVLAVAAPAGATTPVVSETTHITNDPDGGGNGTWATDSFIRTLDVYQADAATCTAMPAGDQCYTATISDSGTWTSIDEAYQPNQGSPASGARITHVVSGKFTGSSGYTFYAPSTATPGNTNVPATVNGSPGTSTWYEQAFPAATTGFGGGENNDWTWTYTSYTGKPATSCETWTDSYADSDGQSATAGNITGKQCVAPPKVKTSAGGPISNLYSGKCLDNTGFAWADGNPLQQWACGAAGGADQQFELYTTGGVTTLRALAPAGEPQGPWCVTAPKTGTGRLVIEACGNGVGAQTVKRAGSYYTFPGTALVMDDSGWSRANGGPVIGWQENGGANQHWSQP